MTRGNQRELARAKAAKKEAKPKAHPAGAGGAEKALNLEARKQRDADIMRAKQQAAKLKK